jgi:predicted nucleotidyltransferase
MPGRGPGLPPLEDLERALTRALDAWPAVRAAWLFGSVASGDAGPLSDVDVAVLGCPGLSLDDRAQLAVDLGTAAGQACDVVPVECASPVLGMAIADTGRRFLCRDADAADAWEDFALRRYLGTAELRRLVYRYVREDLEGSR